MATAIHRQQPLEIHTPAGRDVYLPLQAGGRPVGALVARGSEASLHALVAASRLVGLALEHERLIDEHAHMEALRQSEELKTSLLRAISHDLSTPLTAITIHTEALRRRAASEGELREPVTGIAAETARLRRRIDNLLSMARLEAGKASPRREPAPPADLFRAARENLSLLFEPGELSIHVDDDCPEVNVDPSLALEVLVNLIENARRVSPPGVPVELEAHAHPSDAATVRIEVLDRGPGLPAGVADANGNLLAGAPGDIAQRGMGLEIARSFVAANGGTIALLAREGGGTVARVDLPAAAFSGIAEPA
jgi:two-component system sensor histidine kinase KdpD